MKGLFVTYKAAAVFILSGVLFWMFSASVRADVVQITAGFKPDPAKPHINSFENQTPVTGVCRDTPETCKWLDEGRQVFSIETNIDFNSIAPIVAHDGNFRQGAMFNIPANAWRQVSVRSADGKEALVEVRIVGIGGRYRLGKRVQELTGEPDAVRGHYLLWDHGDWGIAPKPCLHTRAGVRPTDTDFTFLWLTPAGAGTCGTSANFDIPGFAYPKLNFMYSLRTPDPLKMAPGTYTGSINYTVGPFGDFDMGDNLLPTDSGLQLDFTLNVEHVLSVEVPPGGHRVELVSEGGWQAWLNQGRKPTRLFRDQSFNIWTSTNFKMQLECQYSFENSCALKESNSGENAPLSISVSLPSDLRDVSGQPIIRRPLLIDGSGTELFQPSVYLVRKPATLHFEITREHVERMLSEGVAKEYSGNVTVLWDSQI
ncbi:UNVERIFIED_ORG: hypothetical protein J2Y84_001017 [Pseudomonas reinekei]